MRASLLMERKFRSSQYLKYGTLAVRKMAADIYFNDIVEFEMNFTTWDSNLGI